jgi:hypothetical protein
VKHPAKRLGLDPTTVAHWRVEAATRGLTLPEFLLMAVTQLLLRTELQPNDPLLPRAAQKLGGTARRYVRQRPPRTAG